MRCIVSIFVTAFCFAMEHVTICSIPKNNWLEMFFFDKKLKIYGFGITTLNISSVLASASFLIFAKNRALYIKNPAFVENNIFKRRIYWNIILNVFICIFTANDISKHNNRVLLYIVMIFGNMILVMADQLSTKYGMFSALGPWHIFCILKTITNFDNGIPVLCFAILSFAFFSMPTKLKLVKASKKKQIHILKINNIHEYSLEDVVAQYIPLGVKLFVICTVLDILLSFLQSIPYETSVELKKRNLFTIQSKSEIYDQLCEKIVLSCFLSSAYNFIAHVLSQYTKCYAIVNIARDWNTIYDFLYSLYRFYKTEAALLR